MQPDRFNSRRYRSWVKTSLSLCYLKEGVVGFSKHTADAFHKDIFQSVSLRNPQVAIKKCGSCTHKQAVKTKSKDKKTTTWRMNCRLNICSVWLEEILPYHRHQPCPDIAWKNSDPTLWPSDCWELVKLFQPFGCQQQTRAEDCDATGLLTMIQDCSYFSKFITNPAVIQDIKKARNACMHSNDLEMSDADMTTSLNLMVAFLEEPELKKYQSACDAALKIKQLRDNILDLALNRELELKALCNKMTEMEQNITGVKDDTQNLLDDIRNRIDNLSRDMSALRLTSQKHQATISTLYQRQQTTDGTLKTHGSLLQQHQGDIKELQQQMSGRDFKVEELQPTFTKKLDGKITVMESEDITLECQLSKPNKTVKWKKSGEEIYSDERISVDTKGDIHQLVIKDVKLEDKGTYYCYCGDVSTHCTLDVTGDADKREERENMKKVADLRDILMRLYKNNFQGIPISVLQPSSDYPVNDIYVNQELKLVDLSHCVKPEKSDNLSEHCGGGKNEKDAKDKSITSIRDIFYKDKKICPNVYISGEAGFGKSTLCEHLVKLWCDAHSESDKKKLTLDKDLQTMSEFQLLFYINLRNVELSKDDKASDDEIAKLIHDQLKLKVKKYTLDDIIEYLCNACTLVIMDSLDESSSTRLPYRGKHTESCIVITSRPWKLEALRSEIERNVGQQIEIVCLKESSSEDLAENIVKILNRKFKKSKSSKLFVEDIKSQGLQEFLDIPMMIILMLYLWYDGESIGGSQYDIYCRIVHHQIITAVKVKELDLPECTGETTKTTFPICCGKDNCPCSRYGELLWKVTHLAYDALFGENQEMSLVFNHRTTTYYGLSENDVDICLKIGFLTQHKLFVESLSQEKKSVSFLHKTNQEFFASIFLSGGDQQEMDLVKSYVNNDLLRGLELDKVFMFCSQSDQTVTRKLTRLIYDIADCDERVQKYRQSGEYGGAPNKDLVYKIQNILFASVKTCKPGRSIASKIKHFFISSNKQTQNPPSRQAAESSTSIAQNRSGSTPKLIMADIILGEEPQWRRTDRRLVEALDMAKLKSVRINAENADVTIWKLLEQETRSLQSLVVWNGEKTNVENIHGVVVRNLETLRTLGLQGWPPRELYGGWPLDLSGLGNKVSVMLTCDLTCLLLHNIELSHEQCEMLVQRLSEKQNLQRLTLVKIKCQTHGSRECCDVKLQSRLEHVQLWRLPFRDVSFHTVDLKTCEIKLPCNVPAATSALSCLTSASNLREFTCWSLRDVASVQKLVAVLPRLHGLQRIVLHHIDFGSEREIRLSAAAKTLESVQLRVSTITADGLESLVESVKAPRVKITLWFVTIRDRDPRDFLQRLRESPDYEVTRDEDVEYQESEGGWWVEWFVFYKNK